MNTIPDIKLEERMSLDFLDEVYSLPGGDKVKDCIQCGTCSGSCPASYKMHRTPRQVFAMIRAGMRDEVLTSDTIWVCASCYTCHVRCPKNIKIADVFYDLKRIAIKENKVSGNKAAVLSKSFVSLVDKYGRSSELHLLIKYFLKADFWGWISQVPIGWKLLSRGRLPLIPEKIKGVKQIRQIINSVNELEGRR